MGGGSIKFYLQKTGSKSDFPIEVNEEPLLDTSCVPGLALDT